MEREESVSLEGQNTNQNQEKKSNENNTYLTPAIILAAAMIFSSVFLGLSIFLGIYVYAEKFGGVKNDIAQIQPPQVQNPPSNNQVEPPAVVTLPPREDAPFLGKKDAKVVIEEFGDFQCPFCKRFFTDTFPKIKKEYIDTGKAKFVFRHYPLPFHQNAEVAALASECAANQNAFWKYHDKLFEKMQPDGTDLDAESLKKYAKEVGLNTSKFNTCLDKKETLSKIESDKNVATVAGVNGTPTAFINGNRLVGAQPFESFKTIIDNELKK